MSFFGVITFTAPYLPWVLLGFSYVFGGSLVKDLMGMLTGHVYYYLVDVYPRMTGVEILKTPMFLRRLVGNSHEEVTGNRGREVFAQVQAEGQGWGQGRNLDGPHVPPQGQQQQHQHVE